MTLRNMQIFLAVADFGSMSEAAKQLDIAQPSVSGTIAEIEEQYSIRLFERMGRKLYITQTGRQLEEYARYILSMFDAMEQELKNAQETVALRLGATQTVGTCVMCGLLQRYQERCPGTAPQVYVDNTKKIEQMLLRSELDAAIVEGQIESKELRTKTILYDPLVLVGPVENNLLEEKEAVYREDLCEVPFILREVGSGTRDLFERAMGTLPIQERWTCTNSEAILNAVESGFGYTVISRRLAQDRLNRGTLVQIPVEDARLERAFALVWHKNKYIGDPLGLFMQMCSEIAEEN
ncbi:MAG: LysR family transcriptional regulator [Eubacteriales bacterium]|nr:LysR family transcriptional regulator [Eubacteriales bacterium]